MLKFSPLKPGKYGICKDHGSYGVVHKKRHPFLTGEIRFAVIRHIENAKRKQIFIDRLNGYTEHLHCQLGLNADMSIRKAVQLLKNEFAFWINKEKLVDTKFEWAEDYFAVSVSESMVGKVREYIDFQEEHHKKKSFGVEYEEFIKKYGFKSQGSKPQ